VAAIVARCSSIGQEFKVSIAHLKLHRIGEPIFEMEDVLEADRPPSYSDHPRTDLFIYDPPYRRVRIRLPQPASSRRPIARVEPLPHPAMESVVTQRGSPVDFDEQRTHNFSATHRA
jgi:hypothetical protein